MSVRQEISLILQPGRKHQRRSHAICLLIGQSVSVGPFGAISYQKLPHPLGQQIKELPIVDGSNVDKLLEFLVGVFRLKQVGQWNVPMIYKILYPHCCGELLDLLIKAAQNRDSFEVFRAKVLEQIIPTSAITAACTTL
jgi:hypothetical protein